MVSVTCTPHIEEARGAWPLKAPLYYQSRRLFHTICDRVTTSVVNKGASVSTIFGVLTSAMCKWQQPFRVSGSHVKSSQCKINAFFFSFNVPSYACVKLNVWEAIYRYCLRMHAQVHWLHLSWCIYLKWTEFWMRTLSSSSSCSARQGFASCLCFLFFFLRTKEVAYVCCLPFMHPNLLWISFTKRRVFLSSSLSQEASDTRGHFHLSTQVCKDNRLLSHALLYFPCLLASGFEK